MNKIQLTEKHNIINETIFRFKTFGLIGKRFYKNLKSPTKKFTDNKKIINHPVIAISESNLWNPFDTEENWILTAGKVENLRIATKKINGLEIKANQVFSFWKHIGNPNLGKGYVIGREIREGCIVPTIAGGLCQLSNALYSTALQANFDIIERHKHTKVIQGSLAEQDLDATVKWNYLDLRFKSNFDFRIETELTSNKLIVRFKSQHKNTKKIEVNLQPQKSNKLNDCYSCGNSACFKFPNKNLQNQQNTTTFILDENWSEYDCYIASKQAKNDHFIVALKQNRFIKTSRYSWKAIQSHKTNSTTPQALYRALRLRFTFKHDNVFKLSLELDKRIAKAAAKKIPIETTHLVIAQNLLPYIYETGVLGGRTFDVLMNRLPFEKLHERLDLAHSLHQESLTLIDFRASNELINLENNALTKARKIITPHTEIATIFTNKVALLNWIFPETTKIEKTGNKILFPASALGRKGAYEIKKLAQELNLEIVIAGKKTDQIGFWNHLKIEKFNGNLDDIRLVIYPTYIEYQPRLILKALSKGIPVITTKASGITNSKLLKIVELGNFEQLKNEVIKQINT